MKKLYLVFEYCEGGELYETLAKRGKMDEKQAARVFYQILLALNYAHKQGICHRDIKADNCLFLLNASNSPLKVIDFGLAVEYVDPKLGPMRLSQLLGTSQYIAPEVLNRNYKEKCDMWSAGVLLYFMLTYSMPFEAPNELLLFDCIRKGSFECPDGLSPYCVSLVSGLLNTNPDLRLSAAQALNHPWFSATLTPRPRVNLNFNNLARYLKLDRTQKMLMGYIASHTSDALLLNEMNKFLELNASKTGTLSKEELANWIYSFDYMNVEEIFKEIDVSKSRGVSYLDFTAAFLPDHITSKEEVLAEALEFIDKVYTSASLRTRAEIFGWQE
eukprot:TRINITY_DN826_c0_g1_i14.p1 TRINITY_DN826_c0_g1~~TRINITY_DN826_c0_g1_i14.p1  ORF type:complete len:344 (-),score=87.74 TRINITY_DN826_c0_g1_i14:268-1257(-)